jgi:hypothetical protein
MEYFIAEQNLSVFFAKFLHEPMLDQRALLSQLLLEEEKKFGDQAGRLGGLDSYIVLCDAQIARHRHLLDAGTCSDDDKRLVCNVLANITAFRQVLGAARASMSHPLDGPDAAPAS